jgi:ABC-2 type transport system permease protein
MTPTAPLLILFGSSLWSFVESFLQSLIYLAAASLILGLEITPQKLAAVVVVLLLTFACFLSIGMISAAFIMVFKQGNPINAIFGVSSYFLGGLLFPVEVLPRPLAVAASFLPMTRAATDVREILLVAPDRSQWIPAALFLALFALIFLPIGMASLKYSLARAKRDGSLVQF